ncbi:hypothetical protein POPTR_003G209100v4 [Populus trichocarpa]|jgi:hypothetical protein|uniref:Uncharacterized protein n=1 Tax=Populus trichocarpa TaxID=3694 RepID=A0ACC0TAZ5_POPTR|nr:hypothetical protein POPTR_003G209100v4 [Populus trichocarpa]
MNVAGTSRMQMDSGDHVSLDIAKLAESVEGKLKTLRSFSDQCSIYRVPERLRELNGKAYTPRVISIGPLHYGKEELIEMEEHKRLYLREFLELSKVRVRDFIAAIAESETRLRSCYAETFDKLSKEEFVEMVLLDCSFLIMFFLKAFSPVIQSRYIDRIFNKPWMLDEISIDLCLLENQLPFFIVEDLFNLSKLQHHCEEYSMIKISYAFLLAAWQSWVSEEILEKINLLKVEHFVDFLRICQQPAQETQPKKLATITTPSVAELHRAGIKFKLGSSINPLLIKFDDNKGTLEIPQLKIGDHAEILFRNLQAFEQCNYDANKYVCNYITMLSLLVPDAKDVEILVKEGIIENWLHDNDAVSRLFRNLSKENVINVNNFYFSGVVEDLNKYYSKRVHKWKAALKQKYFRNPWTIISVVAAAVIVILTIIQTVCSIIQVV